MEVIMKIDAETDLKWERLQFISWSLGHEDLVSFSRLWSGIKKKQDKSPIFGINM